MDQSQVPPGVWKQYQWQGAGFTQDEIDNETARQAQDQASAGFSPQEIKEYWGKKDPDMSAVQKLANDNVAKTQAEQSQTKPKREPVDVSPKPIESKDILDAMAAAYGNSILQLGLTHQESPIKMSDNATSAQHFANFATGMLADSPFMFLSALGGGPVAAFAVPAAIRATFVDSIRNGELTDDFANRVTKIGWETAKGAITGLATSVAGGGIGLANAAVETPLAKALTGTATRYAAELTAQTTVANALEGQLPKPRDFVNGAIMIGGLHAVGALPQGGDYIAGKFQNIWANTGAHPQEILEAAENNPNIRGQLLSENPNLPVEADRPDLAKEEEKPKPLPAEQKVKPGWELPDDQRSEVLSRIGEKQDDTDNFITRAKDDTAALYVNNVDWTSRVKNVLQKIGKDPLDEKNSYVMMRLFAASNDTVRSFFEHGTRDWGTDEINGEGLQDIYKDYIKDTGDKSLNNLRAFMISDHSLALEKRGISQPGDRANDQAIVSSGEASGYRQYAQRIVDFENRVNRYFGDSGFWTEKQMNAMEKNNTYIPMHKIVDADDLTGLSGSKKGFMKNIGDSDLQLVDPLESIRKNTEIKVKMALENQAKTQFVKDMSDAEEPSAWFRPAKGNTQQIQLSKEELGKAFEQQGIDADPEPFVVFRKNPGQLANHQFDYWENGKRKVIDTDPDIADCLKRMSGNYEALNTWTKVLRSSAYLLRAGVVENPLTGFPVRHVWRNQLTAITLSKTNLAPADVLRFAPEYLSGVFGKGSEDFKNAVYNGAFVNAGDKIPDGYYSDQVKGLDEKVPTIKKAWNLIDDNVLNFSRLMITHADNMARFAELKGLLKQGKSPEAAAFGAREVLPDVQKMGLRDSVLKNITAFLNIHVQGQARMGQALFSQGENTRGYIAKNLAYITVTSLMLNAVNAGDSLTDDIPDHNKWNYWNIHIPMWRQANVALANSEAGPYPDAVRWDKDGNPWIDDGYRFKLQKPFTNGILFGSTPEVIMDAVKKDKPELYSKFLKTVAGSFVAEPVPTGIKPLMDVMNNRDSYTGKPIARYSMENKLPEMDYDAYTTETAKKMAQLLSNKYVPRFGPDDAQIQSPRVIEHLARGYMGSTGQMLLNLSDEVLGDLKILPKKPEMEKTINDSVFMNTFLSRFPDARPQSIDDFEERYKLANQIEHSIDIKRKEGDEMGAARLQQMYATYAPKLKMFQDMITNHRHAQMAAISDPSSTPTEKRQLFDILSFEMIGAAKDGNRMMDEIEKERAGK